MYPWCVHPAPGLCTAFHQIAMCHPYTPPRPFPSPSSRRTHLLPCPGGRLLRRLLDLQRHLPSAWRGSQRHGPAHHLLVQLARLPAPPAAAALRPDGPPLQPVEELRRHQRQLGLGHGEQQTRALGSTPRFDGRERVGGRSSPTSNCPPASFRLPAYLPARLRTDVHTFLCHGACRCCSRSPS